MRECVSSTSCDWLKIAWSSFKLLFACLILDLMLLFHMRRMGMGSSVLTRQGDKDGRQVYLANCLVEIPKWRVPLHKRDLFKISLTCTFELGVNSPLQIVRVTLFHCALAVMVLIGLLFLALCALYVMIGEHL